MTTSKEDFKDTIPPQVRVWLFPILLSGAWGLLKYDSTRLIGQLDEVRAAVIALSRNEVGMTRDIETSRQKLEAHEVWLEELDKRIQTLERHH
jgi:hypothetical protein